LIAVAANFSEVMEKLEADFEQATGHQLTITLGSTGKLYAQIRAGAPFDVMLAADQERPKLLEEHGHAVPGSRFTYAIGRITLWSPDPERIPEDGEAYLREGLFRRLAIANPDLAPYGVAAREVLDRLGLWETIRNRIVMGEDIGQTRAMVDTGNADAGIIALSSVLSPRNERPGSRWDVPETLYSPIRQDAVLLHHGAANAAAASFLEYLRADRVRATIKALGYATD
jgi:molybdate transport system substrate-binding protein